MSKQLTVGDALAILSKLDPALPLYQHDGDCFCVPVLSIVSTYFDPCGDELLLDVEEPTDKPGVLVTFMEMNARGANDAVSDD